MILIFLFIIISLFFPKTASGQHFSLSIFPPLLEVMIQPGKSITKAYAIKNEGRDDLYLKAIIIPFTADSQSGQIIYLEEFPPFAPQFSLSNADLKLGETFKLLAGQSRQLVLQIKIPSQALQDDYYYTLFVQSSPEGEFLGEAATVSKAKVGSHILITVSQSGSPPITGKISQFKAVPKLADLFDKVNLTVVAANTGKAFFKTVGKIEVFDWLGRKKAELELRPDNVLVNSQRKLVCVTETPCSFSSLLPGRYRATVTIKPNGNDPPFSQSISFYLLPFRLSAAVLTVILFFLLTRKKKLFKMKKTKNESGN